MSTLADRPIANAKEATRVAPPARLAYARLAYARLETPPERRQPLAVSRFIDRADAFADHLMTLVFSTGTAQAFE